MSRKFAFIFVLLCAEWHSMTAQQLDLAKYYFNDWSLSTFSYDMAITSDNKILFTGGAYVFHGDTRYFLMKLDSNGDTLWFKTDDPTGLLSEGYAVKEISNGNYVVAVKKYSAHTCLYIVVYDSNGNLLSQQAYLDTLD